MTVYVVPARSVPRFRNLPDAIHVRAEISSAQFFAIAIHRRLHSFNLPSKFCKFVANLDVRQNSRVYRH